MTKPRITLPWKELNATQKRTRLMVYSIVGFLFALGIVGIIFKQIIAGILCILVSGAALFIISNLPKWYMKSFYARAEREFQEHKNESGNTIYLTGKQMQELFENGAVDMGQSMPPIILEEIFNGRNRK